MGKIENNCIVCGKEMGKHERCFLTSGFKSICMGCENVEINVYHIRLPDSKAGYYEKDLDQVMDIFVDCDDDTEYTIKKETMKAMVFHNLPEFTGF